MGQTQYRSKCWVFKSQFSFKVRQHGKQQFNLQYKVCWILYEKVRALSSSKTFLYLQPPLQPPSKIHSSTLVSFHFPTPHYLFTKSCLQSPLPLPFSINQQFFTSFFFRTAIPATPHEKHFSYLSHGNLRGSDCILISAFFLEVWTEKLGSQSLILYRSGSENWCI